jgi:nucleoid-associated protein YgaU
MHQAGTRSATRLLSSLLTLVAVVAVAPIGLVWAARRRFGGASPLSGVDPPSQWDAAAIRAALTDRLTDSAIVDVIVRLALAAIWVAIAVLLVTIVAETAHMVRHGGMALPRVRGLGWSQRIARFVAVGLIVVLPTTQAPRAQVSAVSAHAPAAKSALIAPARLPAPKAMPESGTATSNGAFYTVQAGDSVYQIAQRLTAADRGRTVAVAEHILDLNLGTVMTDGQRFTNAAYIEPGWVLTLPPGLAPPLPDAPAVTEPPATHVVEPGETLWSIARDELGTPARWPEIWEHNGSDEMRDGRVFDDPDLIMPGWVLELPMPVAPITQPPATELPMPVPPVTAPPPVEDPSPSPSTAEPTVAPDTAVAADASAADEPKLAAPAPPLPGPSTTVVVSRAPDVSTRPPPVEVLGDTISATDGRRMIGLEQAAMLSVGVLTLVGANRLRRLRTARPRARVPVPTRGLLTTERALRTIGADDRLLRVDIAIRAAAGQLGAGDRQILAVLVDEYGAVEIVLTGPCPASEPFSSTGDRWYLAATTSTESLGPVARPVGAPCVGLVQLGVTPDSRDLYVDLEALTVLAVDAETDRANAVVNAIATTLGTSVLAEVAQLVGVGLDPAAFVGHRHHVGCDSFDAALDLATSLLGSTALASESTFALRSRWAAGEAWEPAIVLVASDFVGEVGDSFPDREVPGLAVVAAGRLDGARHTLIERGSTWQLEPLGIEIVPLGLEPDELTAITHLVEHAAARLEMPDDLDDRHLDDRPGGTVRFEPPVPAWSLLVRLLGPVDVVDEQGDPATFERSKTRELIAWLATHRERSTRTLARTALWDLDVRDATFSNVVSEARRAMARLVEPAPGEEWLARTLTEDLPLHERVRTDVELVECRLEMARRLRTDDAIAMLRPAVELIRGMPFEGTSYLWPDAEGITSNLVLLATSAASELAGHHLALGQIDGVFWATGQGLQVLPGHEDLIALRMRAHASNGDLAGVRHEWQCYERVIAADPWSDGEPATKLVELRHQLLTPTVASDSGR